MSSGRPSTVICLAPLLEIPDRNTESGRVTAQLNTIYRTTKLSNFYSRYKVKSLSTRSLTRTLPADSWEVSSEEKTLYGPVEEASLSSLRPAKVYQVRVFAENELGRSKEGRVLQVG